MKTFCTKCGALLAPDESFCKKCGTPRFVDGGREMKLTAGFGIWLAILFALEIVVLIVR